MHDALTPLNTRDHGAVFLVAALHSGVLKICKYPGKENRR